MKCSGSTKEWGLGSWDVWQHPPRADETEITNIYLNPKHVLLKGYQQNRERLLGKKINLDLKMFIVSKTKFKIRRQAMSDAHQPCESGCGEASRGCGEVHVPVCWPLWGCGLENDALRQEKLELLEYRCSPSPVKWVHSEERSPLNTRWVKRKWMPLKLTIKTLLAACRMIFRAWKKVAFGNTKMCRMSRWLLTVRLHLKVAAGRQERGMALPLPNASSLNLRETNLYSLHLVDPQSERIFLIKMAETGDGQVISETSQHHHDLQWKLHTLSAAIDYWQE